jgi:fused signal recognition particle receptor
MVVGVNGTGKTTTIGKLAWHLKQELGLSVIVAAADTYRAAAIEQLEAWAERAGVGDRARVARRRPGRGRFRRDRRGRVAGHRRGHRGHCRAAAHHANLMEELAKVRRVAEKRLEGARTSR